MIWIYPISTSSMQRKTTPAAGPERISGSITPKKRAYDLVDVTVTLHDIEAKGNDGNYIWLQNTSATPNINILGVEEVQMTIEYFVAGTQTPYTVNSNFTVSDIDANQYFGFSSGQRQSTSTRIQNPCSTMCRRTT